MEGGSAYANGREFSVGRQEAACVEDSFGRRLEAIAHTHDERGKDRPSQGAVLEQVVHECNVAGIKQLNFGFHARVVDHLRHATHITRRVDDDLLARIHGVEIECADVRTQHGDVLDSLFRRHERGAWAGDLWVFVGRHEASTGPGGHIQDQLGVLCADALDHLAVEVERH